MCCKVPSDKVQKYYTWCNVYIFLLERFCADGCFFKYIYHERASTQRHLCITLAPNAIHISINPTSSPSPQSVVRTQEEVILYPGADTGNFDLSMEFFNTSSVDFLGPYATDTFSGREKTAIQVSQWAAAAESIALVVEVAVGGGGGIVVV